MAKNVTTKIWKKTHRLAKIVASILQITMVELFHEAILEYAENRRVLNLLKRELERKVGETDKGE